jgi:hypothetical protein
MHINLWLNWTEGFAYRNSTIFRSKFKAQSRLSIRCLRSRIWASSPRQTQIGRHSRSQGKKHHNTISTKAKRSYHGVRALLEIWILHILLLFFLIFFLILYHLNRKHNNFQLNWKEDVAYRNSTISAWNLKHHPGSELGALEVEFGPHPMGKPV